MWPIISKNHSHIYGIIEADKGSSSRKIFVFKLASMYKCMCRMSEDSEKI